MEQTEQQRLNESPLAILLEFVSALSVPHERRATLVRLARFLSWWGVAGLVIALLVAAGQTRALGRHDAFAQYWHLWLLVFGAVTVAPVAFVIGFAPVELALLLFIWAIDWLIVRRVGRRLFAGAMLGLLAVSLAFMIFQISYDVNLPASNTPPIPPSAPPSVAGGSHFLDDFPTRHPWLLSSLSAVLAFVAKALGEHWKRKLLSPGKVEYVTILDPFGRAASTVKKEVHHGG